MLKVLYILTTGSLQSANNHQWFNGLKNINLDVYLLVEEPCKQQLDKFKQQYGERYKLVFFRNKEKLLKQGYFSRKKYIKSVAGKIDNIKPNAIHIHGLFYSYMIWPIFFIKQKTNIVFSVWGSDFNILYKKNIKYKFLFKRLIKKSNIVVPGWVEMEMKLKKAFPKYNHKIKTMMWGIEKKALDKPPQPVIEKVYHNLGIQSNDYVILSPRGLSPNSNIHLMLEAVKNIDKPFKLLLHIPGNNTELRKALLDKINKYGLTTKVIVSDTFISGDEMKVYYHISKLCLIIPENDQLSRSVFEAIINDNHIIIGDLDAYKYFKNIIGFNFDIIDQHNNKLLQKRIEHYLQTKTRPDWNYEKTWIKRKNIFENNIHDFINAYSV